MRVAFRRLRRLGLFGSALLLLLIGYGLSLAGAALRGNDTGAPPPAAPQLGIANGDTAVVYGPRVFATPDGQPTHEIQTFSLPPDPGVRYLLRLEDRRATPGSSSRVFVRLNDRELRALSASWTADEMSFKEIELQPRNTLEVTVAGTGAAEVRVSVLAVSDDEVTLYGPVRLEATGRTASVGGVFTLPTGAAPPYMVRVTNGEPDGSARIQRGAVWLNGVDVIAPADIHQATGQLEREVDLLGSNVIEARIEAGRPGTRITVRVIGRRSPAAEGSEGSVSANSGATLSSSPGGAAESAPPLMVLERPVEGDSTEAAKILVRGKLSHSSSVTVTANGTNLSVSPDGSFAGLVEVGPGSSPVTVIASDGSGRTSRESRRLFRHVKSKEPAAELIGRAPALNRTSATSVGAANAFLHSGPGAVQRDVARNAIHARRAAVLRGRVLERDGAPIPGVTVDVLEHRELGNTRTRRDGKFNVVVNGGGTLVVRFSKDGYLPAQREVEAAWQDERQVDDVVLVAVDPQVTTVALGGPTVVARGSVVTDADGTRQATLIFKAGTGATMILPDGEEYTPTALRVRATEYTVGASGPSAMPASLPPTSGYTYAVELSDDDALAANASELRFSRPVAFYLENFLGFPVGTPVPLGYYDGLEAAWQAEPNGRVVKVVGITAGRAELDIDGDGAADDPGELAALGIDDIELVKLAGLYGVGQTKLRSPHNFRAGKASLCTSRGMSRSACSPSGSMKLIGSSRA